MNKEDHDALQQENSGVEAEAQCFEEVSRVESLNCRHDSIESADQDLVQQHISICILSNMDQPILAKSPLQPQSLIHFWKKTAMMALLVFSLFAVIDILLYLHLVHISAEPMNLSFLTDLATHSSILQKKDQLVTLATALKTGESSMNYQHAIPVGCTSLSGVSISAIQSIFQKDHNDMLFVMEVAQASGGSGMFAVYVHGDFGIQEGFDQSINQYYALEIDPRKANLIGVNHNDHLKMDGLTDNLLQCKIYQLQIDQPAFTLLSLIKLGLGGTASQVTINELNANCFSGSTELFGSRLKNIMGIDYTRVQPIILQRMEVYHLK